MKNKKWICFAAAIAFLLVNKFSYAQKENESNKKLVQVWFKNLASHDTVALAAMYTDSALIESPNWEGTKKGASAIREMYSRYFTSSPDLAHSMIHVFTNDKTVVIEYSFSGTMTNLEGTSPEYVRRLRAASLFSDQLEQEKLIDRFFRKRIFYHHAKSFVYGGTGSKAQRHYGQI